MVSICLTYLQARSCCGGKSTLHLWSTHGFDVTTGGMMTRGIIVVIVIIIIIIIIMRRCICWFVGWKHLETTQSSTNDHKYFALRLWICVQTDRFPRRFIFVEVCEASVLPEHFKFVVIDAQNHLVVLNHILAKQVAFSDREKEQIHGLIPSHCYRCCATHVTSITFGLCGASFETHDTP